MKMPRAFSSTDNEFTIQLHPTTLSVSLNLTPLSTAQMTLPPEDKIEPTQWVEIDTPDGEIGQYRVTSIDTDMQTGMQSVYLEHGACTLGDYVITNGAGKTEKIHKKDTIENILEFILGFQSEWDIGTVAATDTIYLDLGGSTLLNAINSMMESIPAYQLEFEQTGNTWLINIKARSSTPVCEGRLSRNLETCSVSYDAQGIVTKVWCETLSGGYLQSSQTILNKYGVHEQYLSINDGLSAAQKTAVAQAYLNAHQTPALNVSISGVELSQITGLDIDAFKLGTACRIAVPWLNVVETETIISKVYSDLLHDPYSVSVTLANAKPDLALMVAQAAGGAGGAAAKTEEQEKILDRYATDIEKQKEYIRLIATDTQWDELGNGTVTVYSQLTMTASAIQSVVSRTGYTTDAFFDPASNYVAGDIVMYDGKMYEFSAAHHGDWTGTDVTQITNLYSSITQNEAGIELLTSKTGITSLGSGETLLGKINVNAGKVGLVVETRNGTDVIKTGSILLAINGGTGHSEAYIEADKVQITGDTTLHGVMTIDSSGYLKVDKVVYVSGTGTNRVIMNNGKVTTNNIDISTGGTLKFVGTGSSEYYDLTASNVPNLHSGASIANDTLTVSKIGGGSAFTIQKSSNTLVISDGTTQINFNKAVSLSGAWSNGTYTVSATSGTISGSAPSTSPGLALAGNGGSTFTAQMKDGSTVIKDTTGYLHASNGAVIVYSSYNNGSYSGSVAQLRDNNLIAGNIKSGITIFDVQGTYSGSSISIGNCEASQPVGSVLLDTLTANGYYMLNDEDCIRVNVSGSSPTIVCSSNVSSIGTSYGTRAYAGAISKSGISAYSYLGFTISAGSSTQSFYITINP